MKRIRAVSFTTSAITAPITGSTQTVSPIGIRLSWHSEIPWGSEAGLPDSTKFCYCLFFFLILFKRESERAHAGMGACPPQANLPNAGMVAGPPNLFFLHASWENHLLSIWNKERSGMKRTWHSFRGEGKEKSRAVGMTIDLCFNRLIWQTHTFMQIETLWLVVSTWKEIENPLMRFPVP